MVKNIIYILSIIILAFGCKNVKSPFTPKTSDISGQLNDFKSNEYVFIGETEAKGTLNEDGSFTQEIKQDNSGIYFFVLGRFQMPIFIKPGNKVTINGSINTPNKIEIKGDNLSENKYLQEYYAYKQTLPDKRYNEFFTLKEIDFIKAVEERTQSLVIHSQDYQKQNGVFDAEFLNLLNQDMAFESAVIKMYYPEYFKFFNPDSTLILSETYDSFLQNIDINNPRHLAVPSYHQLLPLYLDFVVSAKKLDSINTKNVVKYYQIDQLFSQNDIKSKLYINLAEEILNTSVDDFNTIQEDFFKKNIQPEDKIRTLAQNFSNVKHLVRGQNAPDDVFKSIKGDDISFEDLKGKIVYVDVWATWCGPCLRELPYLEKKQEEYKNKDIVFVSISVDESPLPWEAMVKDKKMKGQQWHAPSAWQSALAQNYRITGIPRFLIIDRGGKIFNAYAPRPSFDEFDKVINEALAL